MPLAPDKVGDEAIAQLLEGWHKVWLDLAEPNLRWPFHGGRKGSTYYLIRDALEVHESLERFKMVKWIFHPITSLKGQHSKLGSRRQDVTCAVKAESVW